MEFRDLQAQYQVLKDDIDRKIKVICQKSDFINGEEVKKLEEQLCVSVGVKHCISCANGTDALSLALMTWNIGKNDAVFVPDFTFFSTAEVVSLLGAHPVFVDVCENTFNMSPDSLENAIEEVLKEGKYIPRVVIPVDLFGLPADFGAIRRIADKYRLKILEDGAQGFGGRIGTQKACSFGDIATTSFFPAKPLGCYGDGGAIFTNNDEYAETLRSLRVHGKGKDKYDNIRIGMNSRLDTIQAGILQIKLNAFEKYELTKVNEVATWYSERLNHKCNVPIIEENYYSSWAQYTIRCRDVREREMLREQLANRGIPSMIYYRIPLHMQGAYHNKVRQYVSLNVTEKLCECVLSLPMHPYMKIEDVESVCNVCQHVFRQFELGA